MREDYQVLIDEVTALLGTPATLENRDFGLIAFGVHEGEGDEDGEDGALLMDPVRTRSILRRRSTARVRAWFESFGITRAVEPVRIPPDPSAGVLRGRICVPVRHGGVALGYIWLLDDGALELSDPRLADVRAVARRVGSLLADESRAGARRGELLRALLTAAPEHRAAVDLAEAELAGELGPVAAGPLAVVAVVPWEEDAEGRSAAAPGIPGAVAVCAVPGAEGLAVLVRLRTSGALGPARTAAERLLRSPRAGAAAGIGEPCTGLGPVPGAWWQALAAARAARAESRFGPVARWDRIGPYRLLASVARPSGSSATGAPDPSVRVLLEPGRREMARTAEAFLDCAGQAGRTAALLGVHRQTLYYRLSRVEQLTGLDLGDGEDRLLLHMALKTARLLEG
ncbi:CdaR family transcriptional regulator [Streptomyces sp. CNQ085]|uniref:PucR family transcriptional regulator n=1 Tax=Streptomyces sp. CNQ085 TaxID=2886944 RepID=UPI001F514537|nr:helix-turn-helix domain-containing protein [Streptomyces sp. CNQ085]MCI0385209.1 helix-turn-helix domain-containing protein [Streptomyces sp. CNQ085]